MSHEAHKADHADRSKGGPGSSEQNADKPATHAHQAGEKHQQQGSPTSTDSSAASGGGGEQDRHHSHDPAHNGTSRKSA